MKLIALRNQFGVPDLDGCHSLGRRQRMAILIKQESLPMKRQAAFAAVAALLAVGCGGPLDEQTDPATQQAALLSSTDPLVGTWCHTGWPGCFTIQTSGYAYMTNNGDGCWRSGDLKFAALTPGSTPGTYTGTRYMYGTGVCGNPPPRDTVITMTGLNSFTEVSGNFTASWVRGP
jgi:hypothetical protein